LHGEKYSCGKDTKLDTCENILIGGNGFCFSSITT